MKSAPAKTKFSVRNQTSHAESLENQRQPTLKNSASPLAPSARPPADSLWTFLTNHSHVLVLLARNGSMVLREVALQVGISERAVQRIVADLEASGIIEREKIGRQNRYRIHLDRELRHPLTSHRSIGELVSLFNNPALRESGGVEQ